MENSSEPGIVIVKRALISVSNKTGIVVLAQILAEQGVEILSTGGTAQALREAQVTIRDISEYTGFPEMMDGRLKTLHPLVHGGLLYKRGNPLHEQNAADHNILPIDLLVVNLYPFANTIAKPGVSEEEAVEQIDIGGPAMLRAGAKNFQSVAVLSDPNNYSPFIEEFMANGGGTTLNFRRKQMGEVFRHTSAYDCSIADHFNPTFME